MMPMTLMGQEFGQGTTEIGRLHATVSEAWNCLKGHSLTHPAADTGCWLKDFGCSPCGLLPVLSVCGLVLGSFQTSAWIRARSQETERHVGAKSFHGPGLEDTENHSPRPHGSEQTQALTKTHGRGGRNQPHLSTEEGSSCCKKCT